MYITRGIATKIKTMRILILLVFSAGLPACNLLSNGEDQSKKKTSESQKIAQVGKSILYAEELQGVVYPGALAKDSIKLVKAYIDSWVKRELVLNEARKQSQVNKADIKQKVQQFEYDLLRYALEKKHVTKNLDTIVKKSEIDAYYQNHKEALNLKQNIIQGIFLKIPLSSIQRDSTAHLKISRMLLKTGEKNKKALRDYCVKSAEFYHIEDSVWTNFEALINSTPFAEIKDKTLLFNQSKYQPSRRQNEQYVYYLKVRDFKLVNQEAPYTYIKPRIIELILQKRKVRLIKKLEEDLLKKAQKSKQIKIY